MLGRTFAGFLFCSLFFAVGANTQNTPTPQVRTIDDAEKPVWKLEFVKVKPQKLGEALGYLDDDWMRVREEAKRQGAVLTFHRIVEMSKPPKPPTYKIGEIDTTVLLTEYKNIAAYFGQQTLFALIRSHLPSDQPGVIKQLQQRPEDLFESVDTRLFMDTPVDAGGFKLLARQ
jgi:hypothetical protein